MLLTRQVFSYNNVILYKTLLHTPHSYNNHVNTHNALTKFSEWVKKKTDLLSNDHVMLLTRQVFNYNNEI